MSTPPQFEWQTAESDADWVQLRGDHVPSPHARSHRVSWRMAILFVLVVTVGGWRIVGQDRALPSATELHAVVHDDLQPAAPTTNPHENQVRDRAGLAGYQAQTMGRNVQDGRQATTPDAALRGSVQRLETDSFVFVAQAKDGETVAIVAPQVEAMVMAMRSNFGLANSAPPRKFVVEVSLTQRPGDYRLFAAIHPPQSTPDSPLPNMRYHIQVASPALYHAPRALSDAELLAQSVALPLATHLVSEVGRTYGAEWQLMEETNLFQALILWQLWDLALPLAAWREPVTRWRLQSLLPHEPNQAPVLPARYDDLCAMHRLWLHSPQQIGIPLTCSATDRSRPQRSELDSLFAGQAEGFVPPVIRHAQTQVWIDWSSDAVALATLFEFIVSEYGRESLPIFLQGVVNHTPVNELVSQVFGIRAAEFAADWQAYLGTQYDLYPQDKECVHYYGSYIVLGTC